MSDGRPLAASDWDGGNVRQVAAVVARSAAAVVLLLLAYSLVPVDGSRNIVVRSVTSIAMLAVVLAVQIRVVARSSRPVLRAAEALTVTVTLVLIAAATAYLHVSDSNASAFTEPLDHVDALYLAMMTSTTIGFGDIGTVSDGARIAVMVHMVVNIAVLGIGAKVIVAIARSRRTGPA